MPGALHLCAAHAHGVRTGCMLARARDTRGLARGMHRASCACARWCWCTHTCKCSTCSSTCSTMLRAPSNGSMPCGGVLSVAGACVWTQRVHGAVMRARAARCAFSPRRPPSPPRPALSVMRRMQESFHATNTFWAFSIPAVSFLGLLHGVPQSGRAQEHLKAYVAERQYVCSSIS